MYGKYVPTCRPCVIDLDDQNFEHTPYDPWVAYGRSKTGDELLAVAFDGRHRHRGVRAASVHPGVIHTELISNMEPEAFRLHSR